MTYTYDPCNVRAYGLDRMRFELGDVIVSGAEETCALSDEEYSAVIPEKIFTKKQWKKAKLRCIETIMRRFSYEVDTKVGPEQLQLSDRFKAWKQMYDELKEELEVADIDPEAINLLTTNPAFGEPTKPYFWNGMMSREEVEGQDI